MAKFLFITRIIITKTVALCIKCPSSSVEISYRILAAPLILSVTHIWVPLTPNMGEARKRNRKRKALESDKERSNDETATNDANNVIETKRGGESARSNHSFWRKY